MIPSGCDCTGLSIGIGHASKAIVRQNLVRPSAVVPNHEGVKSILQGFRSAQRISAASMGIFHKPLECFLWRLAVGFDIANLSGPSNMLTACIEPFYKPSLDLLLLGC